MPSRTMMLAIAVFWLATIGWMVYRDQVQEEELPPPFRFDLTDEIGPAKTIQWDVFFQDGKDPVAVCNTSLGREPRRFRLHGVYVFKDGKDFAKVRLIETSYHITLRGELGEVKARVADNPDGRNPRLHAEVQADFWATNYSWKLTSQGPEKPLLAKVPSLRTVFNPLLPRLTLPGLYAGKTWGVTVIDPLENAREPPHSGSILLTASWQAQVLEGNFNFTWRESVPPPGDKLSQPNWRGKRRQHEKSREETAVVETLSCWHVDFTDAEGAVRARIWVRPDDDWVLQQEVYYPEGTLRLVRKSDRKR